jgi:hypothetical protein
VYKGGNSGSLPEIFAVSEIGEHWLEKCLHIFCRETIAVCSQIHTKHINTLCGQNAELLNVKLAVHIVTTGRYI